MQLPDDFREFLKLCNRHRVKYLLIGGYAVGFYGYVRATGDMDVWMDASPPNAKKMVKALTDFGFGLPELTEDLFLQMGNVVRMGVPPLRLEILNSISGVTFDECYSKRVRARMNGIRVDLICLEDLKRNKQASGRPKDLDEIDELP